jgi:hypothetical protein
LPGSIHINVKEAKLGDLEQHRGRYLVIIGDGSSRDVAPKVNPKETNPSPCPYLNFSCGFLQLANKLVRLKFRYVCVLHGGIEAVRAAQ